MLHFFVLDVIKLKVLVCFISLFVKVKSSGVFLCIRSYKVKVLVCFISLFVIKLKFWCVSFLCLL